MISNEKQWCVYKHTNQTNGKSYIGITCQVPCHRWGHEGHNYQGQPKFYNAIQKYGWNNFTHEILFENLSKSAALEKEAELIIKYDSVNYGYNKNSGLDNEIYSKEVYCVETGEVFPSVAAAARAYEGDASTLSHHLHGSIEGRYHLAFGKHWYFTNDDLNIDHYEADYEYEELQQKKIEKEDDEFRIVYGLYLEYKSIRTVSDILHMSREKISRLLTKNGISTNTNAIDAIALDKDTLQPIIIFPTLTEACVWCGIGAGGTSRIRLAIEEEWRICKGYKWTTTNKELLEIRKQNREKNAAAMIPIEQIKQDYLSGMTLVELENKYPLCHKTIGKLLKQEGVTLAAGGKQAVIALDPNTKNVIEQYESIGAVYRSWNMNPNNQTLGKRCKDHKIYHNAIWYYKDEYEKMIDK